MGFFGGTVNENVADLKKKIATLSELIKEQTESRINEEMAEKSLEIQEELAVTVQVGEWLDTVEYDYPAFHLHMDCFWCVVTEGEIVLNEAQAARWLDRDTLSQVDWLPADLTLLPKLKATLRQNA